MFKLLVPLMVDLLVQDYKKIINIINKATTFVYIIEFIYKLYDIIYNGHYSIVYN